MVVKHGGGAQHAEEKEEGLHQEKKNNNWNHKRQDRGRSVVFQKQREGDETHGVQHNKTPLQAIYWVGGKVLLSHIIKEKDCLKRDLRGSEG